MYICKLLVGSNTLPIFSSNVYRTVLFELMVGRYPFSKFSSHTVIWLIGNGHHDSVLHIKGSPVMRWIVESCWEPLPSNRPPFSHIVQKLQHNTPLNKKHSSSEPERLNKLGFLWTKNNKNYNYNNNNLKGCKNYNNNLNNQLISDQQH